MSFWTAVVIMFVVGSITYLRSQRIRGGEAPGWRSLGRPGRSSGRSWDEPRGPASAREEELEHEVEDLRKRIAVLERIATDERGTRRLADEIDKLRD